MALNGDTIIVKKDGTAIASVKSDEITAQGDQIETTSPSSGAWKTYVARRKGWTLNVNYLVPAVANLADLLMVNTTYTIVVCNRDNTSSVTGSAILTTCKQVHTVGNLVTGTFQFLGTGPLT